MLRCCRTLGSACLLVILAVFDAPSSVGQQPNVITEIRVVGTQRIEPSTVMSYMALKPGEAFDPVLMDQSLKSLYGTGLFADVTLQRQGEVLIVQVVENPIINRIVFEGNRRLKDDQLLAEVSLKVRKVYTRTSVQNDVGRLLNLYRRMGRFAASVVPKVIQLPQNRVDLVFEIREGAVTKVRRISFIGNSTFSDRTLRRKIETVESAWFRLFTSSDRYDPERLNSDRDRLRQFYLSQGYVEFRVLSAVAELTPDQEAFIVTFTVDEGQRYRFGEINVTGKLRDVSTDYMGKLVTTRKGDWYNRDAIDKSIGILTDALEVQGYTFANVRARTNRDRGNLVAGITYTISEGEPVYIERIDIVGNVRTKDTVIRRELAQVEGDPLSAAAQRRSVRRIRNLNFFERVGFVDQPGSAPDKKVLRIEVEEKATGELTFGAGFSTNAGFLADIQLRERNLLGKGQDLRLGLTLAQLQQNIDFSFTEPYFLDKDLSAGFDVFKRRSDRQDVSSFNENQTGAGLRMGYQLTQPLRHNVAYELQRREVTRVRSGASRIINQQKGSTVSSTISNILYYDQLNNRFNPTEGYFGRYNLDMAGLGGSVKYIRNTVEAGHFTPIYSHDWVIEISGEVGQVFGIGEDVRLVDRYYLGGEDLRGFEFGGAGPRDTGTDDALGGNLLARGTVELSFPLGLPREYGFSGRAFSDLGVLTDIEESGADITDKGTVRMSVGMGVAWSSLLGPVRVDLSHAVLKEDHDNTEAFRFSLGTRF